MGVLEDLRNCYATGIPGFVPADEAQEQRGLRMLAQVREILPKIAANAERAEAERKVPDENVAMLREVGFTKALQPAAYGGVEICIEQYCPIVVEIAGACASTAWAVGLLAQHAHLLAFMDRQAQEDIWGDDHDTLVSSSVAPLNKAENTEGGVRLSGRFGWSSGCDHAQWAMVGCRREDPVLGEETWFLATVPRSDYEIIDDWHTSGLRGTGSKTLEMKDVFIPEHRLVNFMNLDLGVTQGFGQHGGGLFKTATTPYFAAGFSSVALGVAMRYLDVYNARVKTRVRAYTGANVAENAPYYMRLAESTHQMRAAYLSLKQDWREIASLSRGDQLPNQDQVVMWRANQAYVARMARDAVNRLYSASGGAAWFQNNEMQRLWRDVNMTNAHAYTDYDIAAQRQGLHILDCEPSEGIF